MLQHTTVALILGISVYNLVRTFLKYILSKRIQEIDFFEDRQ